ncbi:MAG TPA: glycoside hydrolase family 3 N-terminal domain-containing protein [Trueperaceae bacterium]|nr:glycoside hydrolase family 3 N-terminal domain-containing protein [Trueperaceae bacterium]
MNRKRWVLGVGLGLLATLALLGGGRPVAAQASTQDPTQEEAQEAAEVAALRDVPVEKLVGRLLLLAFPGSEPPLERLEELRPAGFLFYPSNVPSTAVARETVRALQESATVPLLFGIDQEGGPFTTYRVDDATIFPGNMSLAATGDPALATKVAQATGEELAYAGFNLSFAPVVDVNSNPDNPIIGIRSFGSNVETVSEFGRAYLAGLEAAGVAAVAKHFPGHGDTGTDSHLALPVVDGDRARLDAVELPPFEAMIEAGVPAIMTAHVAFPAIDPDLPATLSSAALTGLLRGELGFDGMIVTDYMDMDAIAKSYGAGEAAVLSVLAGADLVLLGPDLDTQRQVYAALKEAVRSGRLSEERVRGAVAASQAVASTYRPRLDAAPPDYAAHRELARTVAETGATLLSNDGVLPLATDADVLVVAPQPSGFGQPPHLGHVLGRSLAGVQSLPVSVNPDEAEIAAAVERAGTVGVVVLGTYHWLGAFPDGMAQLAERLAATGKPVVVVALGNPDDVRFLPVRPAAYLAVYGYREANLEGAAAVLTGEVEPSGRLPVPAGEYPLGAGLDGFGEGR